MAKANSKNPRIGNEIKAAEIDSPVKTSSPVRNSAIPPKQTTGTKQVTHEMIAKRAYELYTSGKGGNQVDNWLKAERELKGH